MKIIQSSLTAILISSAAFAGGIEDRNSEVATMSADQIAKYQKIAETWAPEFFADQKQVDISLTIDGKTQIVKAIAREDVIQSPFADGDSDFTNNKANFDYSKPAKAQVGFNLEETKTHYFIIYSKYNVDDTGPGSHGQDMEHVWTVIEKDGDSAGKLLFTATNTHGYSKFYSPDAQLEEHLRKTYADKLSGMAKMISANTFVKDVNSKVHHGSDPNVRSVPQFVAAEDGSPRGLKVFVCQSGHAIYKCDENEWKNGTGSGTVYYCVPVGKEGATQCTPILPLEQRNVGYSLYSVDQLILDNYPINESKMLEKDRNDLKAKREKIFEGKRHEVFVDVADGKIKLRENLSGDVARTPSDKKADAQWGYAWGFKTPYSLSIPHAVLKELMPADYQNKISDEYIFNPFIEYTEVKASPKADAGSSLDSVCLASGSSQGPLSEQLRILKSVTDRR